jgi:hypothetical protein
MTSGRPLLTPLKRAGLEPGVNISDLVPAQSAPASCARAYQPRAPRATSGLTTPPPSPPPSQILGFCACRR